MRGLKKGGQVRKWKEKGGEEKEKERGKGEEEKGRFLLEIQRNYSGCKAANIILKHNLIRWEQAPNLMS